MQQPSPRTFAAPGPWMALVPPETASFLCETGLSRCVAGLSFDLTAISPVGRDLRIGFESRSPIVASQDGQIRKRSQSGRLLIASSVERLDRLLVRFAEHEQERGPLVSLEEDLRTIDAQAYATFWADHCRVFGKRPSAPSLQERLDSAHAAFEEGRYWDAIDLYSGILVEDPHLTDAYTGRAIAWERVGEREHARNDIEAARVLSSEIEPPLG